MKSFISVYIILCFFMHTITYGTPSALHTREDDYVTIAILAKDKAHTLPLYLACIEKQTWPANKTYLYIRTNNNNDATADILRAWVDKNRERYAAVYFDATDVPEQVQKYGQHEWNCERFKVLGKIRQASVDWAHAHTSHYFVVDCDNFIQPHTLEALVKSNLPIVAPLLRRRDNDFYSNYHYLIDSNGYCNDGYSSESNLYFKLMYREIKGLVEVSVVHCAYLIRYPFLDRISYDDDSYRYEYVIFSDHARKQKIPQYLDTREVYGRISEAVTVQEFEKEPWLHEFQEIE